MTRSVGISRGNFILVRTARRSFISRHNREQLCGDMRRLGFTAPRNAGCLEESRSCLWTSIRGGRSEICLILFKHVLVVGRNLRFQDPREKGLCLIAALKCIALKSVRVNVILKELLLGSIQHGACFNAIAML